MKKLMVLALAAVLSSGCASIVSESTYQVSVDSKPEKAKFTIRDRYGRKVESGVTPAVVSLNSAAGYLEGQHYTVEMSKPGYRQTVKTMDSYIDDWYWANLLLGGLVGMLGVDPATGAMYNLPERIDGVLRPVRSAHSGGLQMSGRMVFGINYARIEQMAYHSQCESVTTLSIDRPVERYEVLCSDGQKVIYQCEWNDCQQEG